MPSHNAASRPDLTLAGVGDTIETDVRHPVQGVMRVRLQTVDSCAAGNALLLDPSSVWRLATDRSSGGTALARRLP